MKTLRRLFALVFCAVAGLIASTGAALAEPAKVTVGAYVNDIYSVDLPRHAFSADFYVWFRWRDPALNPADSFEVMNALDPEEMVQKTFYEQPLPQPDGSLYQLVRVQGVFSSKFSVARYPFDDQILHIDIEDADMGSDELAYAPEPMVLNPDVTLPGYRIDFAAARFATRDKEYSTAFGDLAEQDVSAYSRATITVPIRRPWVSGAIKKFLPVTLIILCAASALLLAARHVDAQIGLTITALLALVAQQFAVASDLPEVGYLLMLDQIYMASYAFILVLIAIIVLRSRGADEDAAARRPSRMAGFFPLFAALTAYGLVIAGIVWFNLSAPCPACTI